jgi:hypothetical protein
MTKRFLFKSLFISLLISFVLLLVFVFFAGSEPVCGNNSDLTYIPCGYWGQVWHYAILTPALTGVIWLISILAKAGKHLLKNKH